MESNLSYGQEDDSILDYIEPSIDDVDKSIATIPRSELLHIIDKWKEYFSWLCFR